MKCRNISCGREIEDGSKFCPYCGTPQRTVLPLVGGRTAVRGDDDVFSHLPSFAAVAGIALFIIALIVLKPFGGNPYRKLARTERKIERIERRIRRTERRMGEFGRLDPHKYDDIVEEITSGSEKTVAMKLSSNPQGAKIYVEGKYTGRKTPAQVNVGEGKEILLKYGKYSQVFNSGQIGGTVWAGRTIDFSPYIKKTDRINAKAGSKYDWVDGWMKEFNLYGDVEITSDPPGAKIYLDGEYIGQKTPSKVNVVGAEKLEVKYRDWVSTKEIAPDSYKGMREYHVDYTPLM